MQQICDYCDTEMVESIASKPIKHSFCGHKMEARVEVYMGSGRLYVTVQNDDDWNKGNDIAVAKINFCPMCGRKL